MTAISKTWVTLTDAATDADSPVDQALVQGIRDDTVHLREWLGASYYAGAVQDHNHDGVNSALVPVGPNALRNGSFELGTTGWTLSAYAGGTLAQNATDMDGDFSLGITSTVLANGGGTATSDEYVSVTEGAVAELKAAIKASTAGVSGRLEVLWYTAAKAPISASTIYDSASVPTTQNLVDSGAVAPSTARWMRVRLTGGVPTVGVAVGTVYFDGVVLREGVAVTAGNYVAHPVPTPASITATSAAKVAEMVAHRTGTYRTRMRLSLTGGVNGVNGRIYKNGVAYGTTRSNINLTPAYFNEDLSFVKGDLVQLYGNVDTGGATGTGAFLLMEAAPDSPAVDYANLTF